MEKMLKPKSVAVIGASDKRKKIGNILVRNLKNKKSKIKIFPINPRHKIIEKLKTYSSVLEIDDKVDLAIIVIPAKFVIEVLEECVSKKIKNVIIISAGFSESGKKGDRREQEILEIANKNNLNILGPNCLGFINASDKINASFAKKEVKSGGVGLISQSGAFVTGLLDVAKKGEVGFSKIITLGNKTVLDEVDSLNYLAKDSKTKIIGLYLENIKRGRMFLNTVSKIIQKKPVLILKAGNSKKVQKAILSHTGAMAGENAVIKKVFQEAGVVDFENIANLWQTLKIFNNFKPIVNEKLVILTNAGGPGVVATDLIDQSEFLDFYNFSEKEKKVLKKQLTYASSVENPIDILGDADSERYENCLEIFKKIKGVGGVLALITPQAQTDVDNILKKIAEKNQKFPFPIFPILIGEKREDTFQFPVEVINALNQMSKFKINQKINKKVKPERPSFNFGNSSKIKKHLTEAKKENRKVFFYEEAFDLTNSCNIKTSKATEINSKSEFNPAFKVMIIKVDDPAILHKMAQGGVKTGIENQKDFKKEFKLMRKKFKKEKIIAQEQVDKGIEIIIGIKKDPNFGPILLCGVGGILTEIIDEKILWILPVNKEEIKRDLKNSKIAKIFEKESLKLDQLAEEINKVGKMGWKNSWLKEFDINPMFFYPDKKPLAVDVKVKLDLDNIK